MSKCTIHTINQRIQEKYPHLEYDLIEFITKSYFETIREGLEGFKNIEITALFGEFKASPKKINSKLLLYKTIVNNSQLPEDPDNPRPKARKDNIEKLQEKIPILEDLVNRRLEHFKRKGHVIERTGKKEKRPKKNHIIDAIEKEIELKKEKKLDS
jgi:hypothetical protein